MVYKSLDRTNKHKLELKKLRGQVQDLTVKLDQHENEVLRLESDISRYQEFVGKLMNDIVDALSDDVKANLMLNVKVWVKRTAQLMQRVGVFHW